MLIGRDIIEQIQLTGDEYAKAKKIASVAVEAIKRCKAKLILKSGGKTTSDRENEALSSDEYWQMVEAAYAAKEVEDLTWVAHEAAKAEFERQRTNASTERAANRGAA